MNITDWTRCIMTPMIVSSTTESDEDYLSKFDDM